MERRIGRGGERERRERKGESERESGRARESQSD